jgi:sensor histidine kinase YesM
MQNNFRYEVLWCLYAAFLFLVFNQFTNTETAAINTLTIVTIQLVVYQLNLKWILPTLYELKKYWSYILSNTALIILGVAISSIVINYTTGHKNHEHFESHHAPSLLYLEMIFMNALPIVLIIFISFFLYASQKQKQQEEQALALATAEKNFLIQQINPHFLFNALNNIYFLTYKTAPKGSAAIMQLSKMLDYSLYGEKQESVSLKDEIAYINNFIELFKLKDSSMVNIKFDYAKADLNKKIAPLLLIPFVENAFKHGDIENTEKGFISIQLSTQAHTIFFTCINSFNTKKRVDSTKGIGIKNVSRRLDLLYPHKHKLEFGKTDNQFSVNLKIISHA